MKKAISTFIAAVILVAFTISAGAMVTSFLTGAVKFQTQSVSSQAVCTQGALFIDTAMCTRVRDNSLVGYWKLDSVNSTNYTADSSGYGNDGRLFNGTTNCFNATGCINLTAGQIGNALQFDGVNDYVQFSAITLPQNSSSISIWFNSNDFSSSHMLVGDTGNSYIYLSLNKINIQLRGTDSSSIVFTVPTMSTSTFYNIIITKNATNYTDVYLNGVKSSTGAQIYNYNMVFSYIGRSSDGLYFNGTIDEVRIYNRSLSADEISQHYQKGLEKFAVDGYHKTIKASVRNIGTTPLSNLTIFADINGRFYLNNTPENGGTTLPAASEPLTLQAYTYYDGPIKTLKVSVLNCPISMTLTNDSASVGTC